MATHIGKSHSNNFQLILPVLPTKDDISDIKMLRLNILDTILPSISINAITHEWMGGAINSEGGGIDYGEWTTTFQIDDGFENYIILYDWIMYIFDGYKRNGREFGDYEVSADLVVYDNFNSVATSFEFRKIWPSALSDVTLSYSAGSDILSCNVTFMYDLFVKK